MENNTSKLNVFFSYARIDEKIVQEVYLELKNIEAIEIWFDRSDINFGSLWENKIKQGLDACDVVIIFASKYSMASKYVKQEWLYALNLKKPLYIWLIDDGKLDPLLKDQPIFDLRADPFDPPKWHEGIQQIQSGRFIQSKIPDSLIPNYIRNYANFFFWSEVGLFIFGAVALSTVFAIFGMNRSISADFLSSFLAVLKFSILPIPIGIWQAYRIRKQFFERDKMRLDLEGKRFSLIFLILTMMVSIADPLMAFMWLVFFLLALLGGVIALFVPYTPKSIDIPFQGPTYDAKNPSLYPDDVKDIPVSDSFMLLFKLIALNKQSKHKLRQKPSKLSLWFPAFKWQDSLKFPPDENYFASKEFSEKNLVNDSATYENSVATQKPAKVILYVPADKHIATYLRVQLEPETNITDLELTNLEVVKELLAHHPPELIIFIASNYSIDQLDAIAQVKTSYPEVNFGVLYIDEIKKSSKNTSSYQAIWMNWDDLPLSISKIKSEDFAKGVDPRSKKQTVELGHSFDSFSGILWVIAFINFVGVITLTVNHVQTWMTASCLLGGILSLLLLGMAEMGKNRRVTVKLVGITVRAFVLVEIIFVGAIILFPDLREVFTIKAGQIFKVSNVVDASIGTLGGILGLFYLVKCFVDSHIAINGDEFRRQLISKERIFGTDHEVLLVRDVRKPFEREQCAVYLVLTALLFITISMEVISQIF
jgi:hypothetical protein